MSEDSKTGNMGFFEAFEAFEECEECEEFISPIRHARGKKGPWRENSQSKDWAGNAIAKGLGMDPANKAQRAKVSTLLKTWIEKGMFVVVERKDAKRMTKSFIEVGEPADD